MFCAPGHFFCGTERVESRFHVLRFRTHFRRYRGPPFPFSCFQLPDMFSAVPRASGPVFIFCARGLIFGRTEGVVSRFHVLCSRTSFRLCRVRRYPFSCFARSDSFSAVPRASLHVFMFSTPGHVFGGTKGVGSYIHVLRSRNHFRRYRGRWVPFSRFAFPDTFSAVSGASGPVFLFCAPGLVYGGTDGVGFLFHVLRSRTRFRRYRGRRVPFSCFARSDSFSAVPRASLHVFMFSTPGHVFGGTKGVGSYIHVLRSRNHFRRYRGCRVPFSRFAFPDTFSAVSGASGPVFLFCAPGLIFGGSEGVGSRFNVLRCRTRFRRYRGRRVPFSCFARTDSLSAVPRVSGPVFMV
jgi:hypothetical protein